MTLLFDAAEERAEATARSQRRAEIRARAEEAARALEELKETDEASVKLGERLAQAQAVVPIKYKSYRPRGSRWLIEHARVGDDYVYQLFPLKPPTVSWKDVIPQMIVAMDVIFPQTVDIRYVPPNTQYKVKFYTIKIEGVTSQPGWEQACERRALVALAKVDAWPQAGSQAGA